MSQGMEFIESNPSAETIHRGSLHISSLCRQKWNVSTAVVQLEQMAHGVRGVLSWKRKGKRGRQGDTGGIVDSQ